MDRIDQLLGPPQDINALLGPPQDINALLAPEPIPVGYEAPVPWYAPPLEQTDPAKVDAYLQTLAEQDAIERDLFLQEMYGEQPALPPVSLPQPQPAASPVDQDRLGLQAPLTRGEELTAAFREAEEERGIALRTTTLSDELLQERVDDRRSEMMTRHITPEGTDVGWLGESKTMLGAPGYVVGEDGVPRKASPLELLIQSFGRQTLYAGLGYEQQMAKLKREKEARYQQALAQGMSPSEAREDAEAFFQGVLTEVDTERREIRETWPAAIMRNMGLGTAVAGDVLFDVYPYFYEVDDQGNLQNPDHYGDQLAYMIDQARAAGSRAVGLTEQEGEQAMAATMLGASTPIPLVGSTLTAANVVGMMNGAEFGDIMPVPFNPIDRDTATSSVPDSGLRVAMSSGDFISRIAVANARGRGMYDDLMSVPTYREQLGENQWMSYVPALLLEAGVPVGGPIDIAAKTGKGVKFAALAGKLGTNAKTLAKLSSPAKWAQAYRVAAELQDALGPDGTVRAMDIVLGDGDPARVAAKKMGEQLATPFKMQALMRSETGFGDRVTAAQVLSFEDTAIGRHILDRARAKLEPDEWAESALRGAARAIDEDEAAEMLARELTDADKLAVDQAVHEWRAGLEASEVARAVVANTDQPVKHALRTAIEDTTNPTTLRAVQSSQSPYAKVFQLADEGADAAEVAAAYRKAALQAGSMPIRTSHMRVRQLLALADEASQQGSFAGALETDTLLQPYFRTAEHMTSAPDNIKFGAALENAFRHGLEELVDVHMPRDVKFVTDRLMVPREAVTPSNLKEVGYMVRARLKTETIDGSTYVLEDVNLLAGLEDVLPKGVTAQVQRMLTGPVDTRELAFIEDAAKEAAWRHVLGSKKSYYATLAGRTTEQAGARGSFTEEVYRPITDRVMGALHLAARGPSVVADTMPAPEFARKALQNAAAITKQWDAKLMGRWLLRANKQTPKPYLDALEQIKNEVGLVQRRWRSTLAEMTAHERKLGTKNPGRAALNKYTRLRWKEVRRMSIDQFKRQVDRLAQQIAERARLEPMREFPNEAEIVAQALYNANHIRLENIGESLDTLRGLSGEEQDRFIKIAYAMASRGEARKQWSNIVRAFLTTKKARTDGSVARLLDLIEQQLDDAIAADPTARAAMRTLKSKWGVEGQERSLLELLTEYSKASVLEPTPENIDIVLKYLRDKIPQLEGRGASVRKWYSPLQGDEQDAVLRAAQAWQMSADRQIASRRVLDLFHEQHPEFVAELTPNNSRVTAAMYDQRAMLYQGPISVMQGIVRRLRSLEMQAADDLDYSMAPYDQYEGALGFIGSPYRGLAKPTGAEPAFPHVMRERSVYDVPGPPEVKFLQTGLMHGVREWVRGRLRNFGPAERLASTKRVVDQMSADMTLYPSQDKGMLGVADPNKSELRQAIERLFDRREAGRTMDQVSQYIDEAISGLLKAGVDEREIKTALYNSAVRNLNMVTTTFIENSVRQSMRRFGFTSFATPGAAGDVAADFLSIPFDEAFAYPHVPWMSDVLKDLRVAAANGTMIDALEDLHARTLLADGKYAEFALESVLDFIKATKQMSAYGLLSAGIVLGGPLGFMPAVPLARYIGLNILTAPLMMVGTLGGKYAAEATGFAAREAGRRFVDTVSPRAPSDIIFRDVYGKEWTQEGFDALCEAFNIYLSRAEVDQTANVFKTVQRDLRVFASKEGVAKMPWYRQALSYMDWNREAPGMQFAVWTDSVMRRGAFAAALRDGHTPMEAAKLARASVLDYGEVPDVVKNSLNKYLLFATFRAASMGEIIRSVMQGRDEWMRVMRLQMRMHQAAGTWTFGSDHDKVRSFTAEGPEFDYRRSAVAGPQEVLATGSVDIINALAFAAAMAAETVDGDAGGDLMGRAIEGVLDENINPALQALLAVSQNARPTSRGRLVPDVWALALKNAGLWDWAVTKFSISEVSALQERDERRPGAPEFDGVQYVFTDTGFRDFQAFSYLATVMTFNRATQDAWKTVAASAYPPDGYDPKYRGIVPAPAYLVGAATPIRIPSAEDIHQRALRRDENR